MNEDRVFKRAIWIDIMRWLLMLCVVGLNIFLPISVLTRVLHHGTVNFGFEAVQGLFLLACDMYFLPVCLLEPKSITLQGDELVVNTLLWKARLCAADIVSFSVPRALTWGLLRTKRCFYLINRSDIKNFDELAVLIAQRLLPGAKPAGK
ncbi:MAG: hypothetical protein KGS72_06725 [Cyanobacteria bacterium REEB67]|nr:hypothetical protein [Cyanobacteria bacterium REEB67]